MLRESVTAAEQITKKSLVIILMTLRKDLATIWPNSLVSYFMFRFVTSTIFKCYLTNNISIFVFCYEILNVKDL